MKRIDRIRSGMVQAPRELFEATLILSDHRVFRQDKSKKRLRMQKSWHGDELFRLNNTSNSNGMLHAEHQLDDYRKGSYPEARKKNNFKTYLRLLDDDRTGGIGYRYEAGAPGNAKRGRRYRRVTR